MKKIYLTIFVALLLRLVLMGTTLHPDFRSYNLAAYLIAQKGEVFTFYDHLRLSARTDPLVKLYHDDLFIYPPLAYQAHAVFNKYLYPLYPNQAFRTLINDIGQAPLQPQFPLLLILLKLPYLITDIIFLFTLIKLLPTQKYLTVLIWSFNPLILYGTYMLGQFDIFLALGMSLSLLALSNRHFRFAAILLGLSAGFKPFPLFLIPFLPGKLLTNLILGFGSYFLIILPYLPSIGFRQYALLAPQTDKLIYSKIMVSGSQYISLFFVAYVICWWLKKMSPRLYSDRNWLGLPLFLFYTVTNFHPQWIVWIVPFLFIAFIKHSKSRLPILTAVIIYFLVVLLFDPSVNFGLVGINFSLSQFISRYYVPDQLSSLLRSVLAGTLFAVFFSLRESDSGNLLKNRSEK